jgi:hypothetical protein
MRRLLLISLVPFVVACAGPARSTPAPAGVAGPASAVTASKTESQPAAQPQPKLAGQEQPRPAAEPPAEKAPPAGASELGRQFVQALIAGDTGGPSAMLSDGGRRRLEAKLPDYARALAACAGSGLEADVTQNQAMTNVFARFATPCGRFGDLIPLLPPDIVDASQADRKIGACLVALRTVNNALRVENFACTPA